MKIFILCYIVPCNTGEICSAFLMPASCLTYSSTMKMDATCSSETSVDIQRITQNYIPEDTFFKLIIVREYCVSIIYLSGLLINLPKCLLSLFNYKYSFIKFIRVFVFFFFSFENRIEKILSNDMFLVERRERRSPVFI
jgi:hypothetical protein